MDQYSLRGKDLVPGHLDKLNCWGNMNRALKQQFPVFEVHKVIEIADF